jgi:hypothetical protein
LFCRTTPCLYFGWQNTDSSYWILGLKRGFIQVRWIPWTSFITY